MVVYRVEMPDGLGPYWSEDCEKFRYRMGSKHNRSDTHPTPDKDFSGENYKSGFVFGFDSMQKLFQWFGGFIRTILNNGGKIVKYTIDDNHVIMGHSGRQLVFDRDSAQLVTS